MSSTKGIDFTSLSLRDALDLAILIEEEAMERYMEFADQMEMHNTPEAASFFRFMSSNEAKHGSDLSDRRRKLFKDAPRTVTRSMIFDVEAPEYDQARAFMSPQQALISALRSEVKAHAFFVAAIPQLKDADVRKLFEELRDEEVQHKDLVKKELAKLPPDHGFDPNDFVDEPVAQ
jgi:erythrin-vacuolar iron transport family protein